MNNIKSDGEDGKLAQTYNGLKFVVSHCDGALETFHESASKLKDKEAKLMEMKIAIQLKRLSDGKAMSRDSFVAEGNLPNGKKFYAIKRVPVRGYLWLSSKLRCTYYISHYKYKDHQKLRSKDTNTIHANWRKIEE
ncbi:hypothetical protein NI531_18075 [Proteus penneri]|uniref:hypothetical protein n=1 Tax=Proteus penneri TaxID=102862 RepID=UPI00209848C3|nr:hypothetical protein [Proteus penneri]MCO8052630.1 hypothetical protein [Proteus penneri]